MSKEFWPHEPRGPPRTQKEPRLDWVGVDWIGLDRIGPSYRFDSPFGKVWGQKVRPGIKKVPGVEKI